MKLFCNHEFVKLDEIRIPIDGPGNFTNKVIAGCIKCKKIKKFSRERWMLEEITMEIHKLNSDAVPYQYKR